MFFFARKLLNASDSSDKWFKVWSHRLASTVLFENLFYQHHASYFVPVQDPGAGSQNWCLFSILTQTYGSLPLPSLSRCPWTNPLWKFWKFQDSIFNPSWEKQRTQPLVICFGQLVGCWTISLRFSQETYKPKPFDIGCSKATGQQVSKNIQNYSNIHHCATSIYFLLVNRLIEGWLKSEVLEELNGRVRSAVAL